MLVALFNAVKVESVPLNSSIFFSTRCHRGFQVNAFTPEVARRYGERDYPSRRIRRAF